MKIRVLAIVTLFFLAAAGAVRAADTVEKNYLKIRESYLEFIEKKSSLKTRRDLWMRYINGFGKLQRKYPKHARADDALYWVGDAYQRMYDVSRLKSDLRKAVEAYTELIRIYPNSNLADDVAFFTGQIYEEKLQSPTKAYGAYARCCDLPNGDMAKKAVVAKARLGKYAPKPKPTPTPAPTPAPTPTPKGTATPSLPTNLFGGAIVQKVDVWSNPDYTRIVIHLNKQIAFTQNLLPPDPDHNKPRRLFLDFAGSQISPDLPSNIPVGDGLLRQVRVGQFKPDVVRVVLDIQSIQTHRVFPMVAPYRVIIDVTGTRQEPLPPTAPEIRRIVIDAGHGGKDPGATSYGSREKKLALTIARKTARNLRDLGFEVIMTRNADRFITLEGRTAIANKFNADLFISIHINASRRRAAQGIETFHFAPRAKAEDLELVATENMTAQAEVEQMDKILSGIELGYKKMESNALATDMQKKVLEQIQPHYGGTVDRGVKSAPFYVLMGANMPAVLIECGFITNRTEHKRLNYSRYQDRIAKGIAQGVADYVRELNPQWKPGAGRTKYRACESLVQTQQPVPAGG